MSQRIPPDDPFVGLWLFDEASAEYQLGSPPHDASYDISSDGQRYTMTMRWSTGEGHTIEQTYNAIPDGVQYEFSDSPGVDSFDMTRVNPRTLDTTARKDGAVVSHASRALSPDGQTMRITTEVVTPKGDRYTNLAVYVRSQPPQD